jgi:hypothetical protein
MTLENRSQAWIQAVKYIWSEGRIVYDKDERLREVQNLVLQVQNPVEENKEIEEFVHPRSQGFHF